MNSEEHIARGENAERALTALRDALEACTYIIGPGLGATDRSNLAERLERHLGAIEINVRSWRDMHPAGA